MIRPFKFMFRAAVMLLLLLPSCCGICKDSTLQSAPFAEEKWSVTLNSRGDWQALTSRGDIVASTDTALICLDGATGAIKWERSDLAKLPPDFYAAVPFTDYAMISIVFGVDSAKLAIADSRQTDEGLSQEVRRLRHEALRTEPHICDVTTGTTAWSCRDTGLKDITGLFAIQAMNAILLYGTSIVSQQPALALADLGSGQLRWLNDSLYPGRSLQNESEGHRYLLVLGDSTFLELFSSRGLRRMDARTGSVLWETPIDFAPVPPLVRAGSGMRIEYHPIFQADFPITLSKGGDYAYVRNGKTVIKVDIADGKQMWLRPPKFPYPIRQIAVTDCGIVVQGASLSDKHFITAISDSTGAPQWKKAFKRPRAAPFVVSEDRALFCWAYKGGATSCLKSFRISDGTSTVVIDSVRFKGKFPVTPDWLELFDNRYIFSSTNDLASFDSTGRNIYTIAYKAPSMSAWTVAAVFTTVIAGAWIAGPAFSGVAVGAIEGAFTSALESESGFHTQEYVFMLTNVEGGSSASGKDAGLVKVSKHTGQVVKRVKLGSKNPQYLIDFSAIRLFTMSENNKITCYDF